MDAATQPGGAEVGLHWWTAATHKSVEEIQHVMGKLAPPETPGAYGQPCFRVHESGTRIYCGSERPTQPSVINAPGEVCEGWSTQLLNWSVMLDAWATRYDVALDIGPEKLARRRLREMDSAFKRDRCDTAIRRRHLHQSDEGWTLYMGGKSSPLMMRAYDQRGPLRIEWQHRPNNRDVASDVAARLLNKGMPQAWRTLAQAVKFPMAWYRELLSGSAEILPSAVRGDAALDAVVCQLRKQWGGVLWAFQALGIGLDDLVRPPESLRGSQAAKLRSWAAAADTCGYDGEKLRQEVERLCPKSK
jgi:hypothetical protein